jgi:hypothetical protein
MQNTLRCYIISVRITIIQKKNNNKCWGNGKKKELLFTAGFWEDKFIPATMEISMEVSQKIKNRIIVSSSHTISGHIPKRIHISLLWRHLCTHIYHGTVHNSQIMESA